MSSVRRRLETRFHDLGLVVYDHRWVALLLMLALTVPLIMQLPKITVDTRTESFFLEGDTALTAYSAFRDQFGMDEFIVVAVSPPEVFDLGFLARLRELHLALEQQVPHVAEVTSLINARNTRGEEEVLIVEDLMEEWPQDQEQLQTLRQRVLSNPVYVNNLISEDATFTTIVIKPRSLAATIEPDVLAGFEEPDATTAGDGESSNPYLSSTQSSTMVEAIADVLAGFAAADFELHLAGGPVVTHALNRAVPDDLARVMPLSVLIVAIFLLVLFRRVSGLALPILIVVLALLATLGVMAAAGFPMTNVTSMLSSFLTVVGVADAVHILSAFYQHHRTSGDKRTAIAFAFGHSGLAILMTSVTTAVGLLSFTVADVRPIAELGMVAPIGIGFALVYTLALLPALIAIFPIANRPARSLPTARMDRLLAAVSAFSCSHVRSIMVVALLVTLVSVAGMTRLRFSQNGLKWFKEDSVVRRATELVDAKLRGTLVLEVVIDTGVPNGVQDPRFLIELERSLAYAESLSTGEAWIGKATSLDVVVKEINRALHGNSNEHYAIPEDPDLVAQELLLFEGTGADDLEQLVDRDFSMVRATLKGPFRDAFHYVRLIELVEAHFKTSFPQARITITGSNALYVKAFHNLITTMTKSYALSLSIITVLMMVLIGRVRIGVLSMVPNLLPLVIIMGIMGWLDIPFDMSTVLIGSVAIGLVVDDTIHFMHNFRRYFEQEHDVTRAVGYTLHTAGRAILVTSIVLAGGFYACMTSELRSTVIFGALMGTTVLLALAADSFVTPALMMLVHRQWEDKSEAAADELGPEVAA